MVRRYYCTDNGFAIATRDNGDGWRSHDRGDWHILANGAEAGAFSTLAYRDNAGRWHSMTFVRNMNRDGYARLRDLVDACIFEANWNA